MKKTIKKNSPFVFANDYKYKPEVQKTQLLKKQFDAKVYQYDFLNDYKIHKYLKVYEYGVRPKLLRVDKLILIIEDLYEQRFKDEVRYVRQSMNMFCEDDNVSPPESFYKYVYKYYKKKYKKNQKLAEQHIIDLVYSVHHHKDENLSVNIFYLFFNKIFKSLDLNCFLLLRSNIQKTLKEKNQKIKFKSLKQNMQNFEFQRKKGKELLSEMFKECEYISSKKVVNIIFENQQQLNAQEFLLRTIEYYKQIRETKNHQSIKEKPKKQKIQSISKYEILRIAMKKLVFDFVDQIKEDQNCFTDQDQEALKEVKEIIFQKLDNLLSALKNQNIEQWNEEMLIEEATEYQQQMYIKILEEYQEIINQKHSQKEVKEFCKKVFKIEEISNQISGLLTYIIENKHIVEEESHRNNSEQNKEEWDETNYFLETQYNQLQNLIIIHGINKKFQHGRGQGVKKQSIFSDQKNTKDRTDKLFHQIMQSKIIDNPKIPDCLQHDSSEQVNEYLRYNINQNDLDLSQSIFSRKQQDSRRELEGVELEIDFGCFEFQKEFYKKYILQKDPQHILEHKKEQYLKIKVKINPQNSVNITKIELQNYLTEFRNIYKSFYELKSFLTPQAIDSFYQKFDFKIFVYRKQTNIYEIQLEEQNNTFQIQLKPQKEKINEQNNSEEHLDPGQQQEELKQYTMDIFKKNILELVINITGIQDLTKEQIILIIYQEHKDFLIYMIDIQQFSLRTDQNFLNLLFNKDLLIQLIIQQLYDQQESY